MQYRSAHPLEVLPYPPKRRNPSIEPGELFLDGSYNPALLGCGGEREVHLTHLTIDDSRIAGSAHLC